MEISKRCTINCRGIHFLFGLMFLYFHVGFQGWILTYVDMYGKTSPGSVRGKSVNVLPPFISVLRRGIEIDPSWPWQPRCKRESPKKALYQLEVPPNHDPVNQRVVLFTFTWEDYCRVPSKETEFILSTAKWFCPCVYQLRIMVIQCFFTFWNCRGHLEQSFMSQVCGGFAGPFLSASR